MSTLSTKRIAAQVQIETGRRLVACQAEQKIFQRFQWQLTAGYVQMFQTQRTGEELLERWRYLFAFLRAERIVRHIQMGQMRWTATQ